MSIEYIQEIERSLDALVEKVLMNLNMAAQTSLHFLRAEHLNCAEMTFGHVDKIISSLKGEERLLLSLSWDKEKLKSKLSPYLPETIGTIVYTKIPDENPRFFQMRILSLFGDFEEWDYEPSECADYYCMRAEFYVANDMYKKALEDIESAILFLPRDPKFHYLKGTILGMLKENDKAIAAFDAVIGLDPLYVDAHNSKALLLMTRKRYSEAEEILSALVQCNIADYNTHYALGSLYLELRDRSDAIENFQKAVKHITKKKTDERGMLEYCVAIESQELLGCFGVSKSIDYAKEAVQRGILGQEESDKIRIKARKMFEDLK